MAKRVVVIGGNAAGMTAAGRAKRLQPDLEILVIEAGHFISYSICGVPYLITGTVTDYTDLVRFTPESLEKERGIRAWLRSRVEEIQPGRRRVQCRNLDTGDFRELDYDALVLATGYLPKVPRVEGCDLDGVYTVSRLEHGLWLRRRLQASPVARAVVIGAGYIGLMMTDALRSAGLEVTLIEQSRQVFQKIDEDLAREVEAELRTRGVRLLLETTVRRLCGRDGVFRAVEVGDGEKIQADLAVIDVGVEPNTELAVEAGVPCGPSGAIQVDERGQTRVAGILAAGNCAETIHLVSGRPVFSALGTVAAKQGRVVGETIAGRRSTFPGTLETTVEKVFSLSVSRTGLTLREALACGFEARSIKVTGRDRSAYFPGNAPLHVKLVFDRSSARVLGAQMVGEGNAAKRIDVAAAAISAGVSLTDLSRLDLAYAPPFATLWDPLQIAAHAAQRELDREENR